jgi:superfamily II DNA or RNA helicase
MIPTEPSSSNPVRQDRSGVSSSSEDLFVDIFQEALGFERTQLLAPQYPVSDIYGAGRWIDFAFISRMDKYAFEIDGEAWHSPTGLMISPDLFRDSLLRQNSLIYQGWKVYRWTDAQLAADREQIKEQLVLFLEREITEGTLDGFLPPQQAGEISLHEHQSDALSQLMKLREQGKTIALITHATGTGKTHLALADAKRLNVRTLYLAHRTQLLTQTQTRLYETWAGATSTVFRKKQGKPTTQVVLATFQSLIGSLQDFDPQEFGYIIVDEAHHAPAETFRKVIGYFKARFILGLTATPERHDGQSLLEIFQASAHRLELDDAIAQGLLVPIRCVRVKTNVDLSKIRFNGVDYRSHDLGKLLIIPSRDQLIADTYVNHALGKKAVCFCIDVAHAEQMAIHFNQRGIPAAAVSGRMSSTQRETVLNFYGSGEIHVICACDILNEGWDSPETEVLLMARPTLSKVIYVQQLGRGTRPAAGKDYLLVFDFIDNTSRYAQAMSAHRLFKKPTYHPGGLVAAPDEMERAEKDQISKGDKPEAILALHLWVDRYEPIDIFRWQDEVKDMFQASELEVELGVGDGRVRHWIETGKITPDHTIELGYRIYHYFKKDRLAAIQEQFNITPITKENIKSKFFNFVREMDMSSSYKPVLLLGMLNLADHEGRVSVSDLVVYFRTFYETRLHQGLVVESSRNRLFRVTDLSNSELESTLLAMPFEKFERRRFMRRLKEVSIIKFSELLWNSLTAQDKLDLSQISIAALDSYFNRL